MINNLSKAPVKSTPQKYEAFIKALKEELELERSMWTIYCNWGKQADMISLGARHRVILMSQIRGDEEEYLKKIQQKRG